MKKAKQMPNYDAHAKHHFFMPNHYKKKAKFLEFDLKNANLATLVTTAELRHMQYNMICDVTNRTVFIMSAQWMINTKLFESNVVSFV